MPIMLILSVLLTLAAAATWFVRRNVDDDSRGGFTVGLSACLGFAALFFAWSCVQRVSTRDIGIVTSFGQPVGTMTNGLHAKWPWEKVSELTGTIQTDNQVGDGFKDGKCSGGTPVRLANNSTACVDNTIRWRINPDAADTLFRDYASTDHIRDSLVTRELASVLNHVFSTYNPLSSDGANGPNLDQLSAQATNELKAKIGTQIEVQNVIISIAHLDQASQDKVNALQSQIADTHIAQERQKTAAAEAEGNKILAESLHDPYVLVSKCLDGTFAAKQPLSAAWGCMFGNGMPVTIPAR